MLNALKPLNLFAAFAPAVLIVTAQVVCYPLLTLLYGEIGLTEILILTAIYSSMAAGQLKFFSQKTIAALGLVTGTALALFGLYFSNLVLFFIKSFPGRAGLTGVFVLFIFLAGQVLLKGVYDKNAFNRNYTVINFFAFFTVIAVTLMLPQAGFSSVFIFAGALLCLLSSENSGFYRDQPRKQLELNAESMKSIGLGLVSAGFVSCYFRIIYIGIYPTGYEFNVYLALSFLFLAAASGAHHAVRRALSAHASVLAGIGLGVASLFFFFGGSAPETFFFDPLRLFLSLPHPIQTCWFYTIGFCAFFLMPYVFFAGIIPLREAEAKGINHMFFCSVGNVAGFLLFGFVFIDWG